MFLFYVFRYFFGGCVARLSNTMEEMCPNLLTQIVSRTHTRTQLIEMRIKGAIVNISDFSLVQVTWDIYAGMILYFKNKVFSEQMYYIQQLRGKAVKNVAGLFEFKFDSCQSL